MSQDAFYYPSVGDAQAANARFFDGRVRDLGLLESALARPRASVFGQDAYPDLWTKAAALPHSMIANHPFVDGNKRTALGLAAMLLGANGADLSSLDEDTTFDLVIDIAGGKSDDVNTIAKALRAAFGQRD